MGVFLVRPPEQLNTARLTTRAPFREESPSDLLGCCRQVMWLLARGNSFAEADARHAYQAPSRMWLPFASPEQGPVSILRVFAALVFKEAGQSHRKAFDDICATTLETFYTEDVPSKSFGVRLWNLRRDEDSICPLEAAHKAVQPCSARIHRVSARNVEHRSFHDWSYASVTGRAEELLIVLSLFRNVSCVLDVVAPGGWAPGPPGHVRDIIWHRVSDHQTPVYLSSCCADAVG